MPTENYTTKFKVDISDLKNNIKTANAQIKTYAAEIKNASAGMKKGEETADSLTKKINAQQKIVDSEKAKLQAMREQLERYNTKVTEGEKVVAELIEKHRKAAEEYGENSEQVKALSKQLQDAQAAQERNKTAVQQLNTQIINQDTAVKNAEAALGTYQNKLKDVTGQNDTLTDKVKKQETELQELKQKYINISAEQGATSDESKELARQIDALSTELKDNKAKLSEAEKAADEFDHSLEDVDEEAKSTTSGGLDAFAVALGNLAAKVITAAISKLGELADSVKEAYLQFDGGRDAVVKATGVTGKAAKEMTKSYANVAKSVVGDFTEIGGALGEVNTRFGYTDEELEKATEQFLKFADITNSDAVTAVRLVSRAMGDAGIDSSEYSAVLDQLATAAQASGISVNKLTENLTKYGAPMRALGFDTKESISIFSQWEKAGVNTEIAFSGMKTAIANWSAEGKNAKVEFKNTLDEIASAPDIATATTKAIEIFGKKAGPDLADAIQAGRFEYSEFLALLENSEGTVTETYEETQSGADKAKLAIQQLKTTTAEIVNNFLEKYELEIESAIKKIEEIIEKLAPKIEKGIQWLIDNLPIITAGVIGIATAFATWKFVGIITAVTTALKGMTIAEMAAAAKTWLLNTALLANPIGLLIAALAGLVAAFVVLWNKCDWFREFWINAWEKIKEVAAIAWEKIKGFFTSAWDKIQEVWGTLSEFFSNLWENAKSIFSTVADWINTNIFQPIINFFKPVVQFYITAFKIIFQIAEGCWKAIKAIWGEVSKWFNEKIIQPVKKFFSDLWGFIKAKASATWNNIKLIWNVVSSWFKSTIIDPVTKWFTGMWNGLKDGASKAWEGIKKVFTPVADWFKQKFKKAWENVKTVFSTGGKVFEGIKDGITEAFKTVVNAIIRGINNVIAVPFNAINDALDIIRNINIAGIQPFEGLISRFDIPQIPELAKGGIVDGARKVIVGEKGKEAIIPLENNKRGLKEIASLLYQEMPAVNGSSNSSLSNVYNFYQTNNSPTALSRWEIYRQTKNLLSTVQGA